MNRVLPFLLAIFAVTAAAGYGVFMLFQSCQPLDRLFGISGCERVIRIVDFRPQGKAAISAPDGDGVVSIFGHGYSNNEWHPAVVHLDLESGEELARHPVRVLGDYWNVIFSEDSQRAIIICIDAACFEGGYTAAIVSVNDGSILEGRQKTDDDLIYFPGDTYPKFGDPWVQLSVAGGARVLVVQRDDTVSLLDAEGNPVATLFENRRNDILRSGVSVSPSGNRVALFDYASLGFSARLYVWDAFTGQTLIERDLGQSYRWRVTPSWTLDETKLTLVRRNERDTFLELHSVP
ncbi:hypothetical protein AAIB41_11510 [Brucella sp. BE17]|uniref:hypothetical protein n=1 Tax=Brucella sp. BE17 TaxID=3142977 RepID=UPI0031BB0658